MNRLLPSEWNDEREATRRACGEVLMVGGEGGSEERAAVGGGRCRVVK